MALTKTLRVLLISNLYPDPLDPAKGVFVRNIERSLLTEGIDVDVVAISNTHSFFEHLLAYIYFYKQVLRKLFARDFDLIYPHYVSHCAPPILFARLLGVRIPIVSHVHGSDVIPDKNTPRFYGSAKRWFSSRLLAISKKIIVPSPYYLSVLCQQYAIDKNNIHISPSGGVDLDVFHPNSESNHKKKGFRVGYVGRLTEDKGILDFIALIGTLRDFGLEIEATVIGDGTLRSRVERSVQELGIDYLPRLGQEQLAEVYRSLDLFVFPTRRMGESLGLVGLEAMACGVPVVAYYGAGPETYIKDHRSGFLVAPGDLAGLVAVVQEYSDLQPEARDNLRASALQVAQAFNAVKVRADLAGLLRKVAA